MFKDIKAKVVRMSAHLVVFLGWLKPYTPKQVVVMSSLALNESKKGCSAPFLLYSGVLCGA